MTLTSCQSELKRGYLAPDRCNLPSPPQTSATFMKDLCMVQTSVTHRSCLLSVFYSAPWEIWASFPIPIACWSSPRTSCAHWSGTDYCRSVLMERATLCGVENGKRCQRFTGPPLSCLDVKVGTLECCFYRSDIKLLIVFEDQLYCLSASDQAQCSQLFVCVRPGQHFH